jgi:hypothetical protein
MFLSKILDFFSTNSSENCTQFPMGVTVDSPGSKPITVVSQKVGLEVGLELGMPKDGRKLGALDGALRGAGVFAFPFFIFFFPFFPLTTGVMFAVVPFVVLCFLSDLFDVATMGAFSLLVSVKVDREDVWRSLGALLKDLNLLLSARWASDREATTSKRRKTFQKPNDFIVMYIARRFCSVDGLW